jgi:hypothetical protein
MPINEHDVKQLIAMGFGEAQAQEALTVSDGNLEVAVNYLLGGGIPSASAAAAAAPPVAPAAEPPAKMESMEAIAKGLVTCGISQYNVDNGRSACTCIALTTASNFLENQSVDSAFLTTMIHKGVENYQKLSAGSSVEHLSAEEVLQTDRGNLFAVETIGDIRQGVLSNDPHHPLGLMALLQGLRQESQTDWLAILITKTPETVLVCFPPASVSPSSYWLIDSHPRPQLGVESAYAKLHPDLDSLALSLQAIFPCTELGPDIPEMMAMMYNSFDLYPLKRRRI